MEPDTHHLTLENDSVSAKKSTERKTFIRGRNLFKIALLGDVFVGKTAITYRYTIPNWVFPPVIDHTIGVAFGSRIVKRKNVNVKLQLWDTGGQDATKKAFQPYYRGEEVDAIIVVYSVIKRSSFDSVER